MVGCIRKSDWRWLFIVSCSSYFMWEIGNFHLCTKHQRQLKLQLETSSFYLSPNIERQTKTYEEDSHGQFSTSYMYQLLQTRIFFWAIMSNISRTSGASFRCLRASSRHLCLNKRIGSMIRNQLPDFEVEMSIVTGAFQL